jgi:lysophospholipase L1-like esterase
VGAPALSDAVPLTVAPGTVLVISVCVQNQLQFDARGLAQVAAAPGDQTLSETLKDHKEFPGRPLVTGIDVLAGSPLRVIAVLGDSLSDGNRPQVTPFKSWPEVLAERLNAGKSRGHYAVVNAGIAGNQLLSTAAGTAGLSRLDRDVLRIEGLSWVILLEGENDIGMAGHGPLSGNGPSLSAGDLIAGYRQVIARAHARGSKVAVATMLPFGGAPTHFSIENNRIRNEVNEWIRTSHEPDAVFDFEKLARDPNEPTKLGAAFDSGDHLHPGAEGFRALANSIDLAVFK